VTDNTRRTERHGLHLENIPAPRARGAAAGCRQTGATQQLCPKMLICQFVHELPEM